MFNLVSIPHRFNSHKEIVIDHIYENIEFQSLTGSIHTRKKTENKKENNYVSIPHRFNSHPPPSKLSDHLNIRFNPSQVQFTHFYVSPLNKSIIWFQSLTGSIHTRAGDESAFLDFMFQSLTGSIHTLKVSV